MYRNRATRRGVLEAEIVNVLRDYSIDAQHVGHAFANLHGLGATDLQALIAVDRLERAGHIRRDRDTTDRRKVFLRYAEPGARLAVEFFGPLGRRSDTIMSGFSEADLETVHRFLSAMVGSMREQRDEVRAARPDGPGAAR